MQGTMDALDPLPQIICFLQSKTYLTLQEPLRHTAKALHTGIDTEAPPSTPVFLVTEGKDFQMLLFTQVSIPGCEALTQLPAISRTQICLCFFFLSFIQTSNY